jgi:hypothetical protein
MTSNGPDMADDEEDLKQNVESFTAVDDFMKSNCKILQENFASMQNDIIQTKILGLKIKLRTVRDACDCIGILNQSINGTLCKTIQSFIVRFFYTLFNEDMKNCLLKCDYHTLHNLPEWQKALEDAIPEKREDMKVSTVRDFVKQSLSVFERAASLTNEEIDILCSQHRHWSSIISALGATIETEENRVARVAAVPGYPEQMAKITGLICKMLGIEKPKEIPRDIEGLMGFYTPELEKIFHCNICYGLGTLFPLPCHDSHRFCVVCIVRIHTDLGSARQVYARDYAVSIEEATEKKPFTCPNCRAVVSQDVLDAMFKKLK